MESAAHEETPQEGAQAGKAGAHDAEGLFGLGPERRGDPGVGFVGWVKLVESDNADDRGDPDTIPTSRSVSALCLQKKGQMGRGTRVQGSEKEDAA